MRTLSQVRAGVHALARALDAAAWSGHPTAVGAMRVAQFPYRGNDAWVALPFAADWRWLLDRSDSPWYPTMRLFRQQRAGDWDRVFEDVAEELRSFSKRQ